MIRCVVFDFDGTLVDSNAIKRQAFYDVVQDFDPSGATMERVLNGPNPGDRFEVMRGVADLLARAGRLPPARDPQAWADVWADTFGRICEESITGAREIPGASETLRWLRERGATLFVSSATPQAALERVVARRDLAPLFTAVHGRPAGKPEHLCAIARRTGVTPSDVLMVGDGEDDRQAAHAFGCPFVGIAQSNNGRFAAPPQHRIVDLHALRPLCEHIGGIGPLKSNAGETRVAARSR